MNSTANRGLARNWRLLAQAEAVLAGFDGRRELGEFARAKGLTLGSLRQAMKQAKARRASETQEGR